MPRCNLRMPVPPPELREAKVREQREREAKALRDIEERQQVAQLQAARSKALAGYINRIQNKIKGNIIPPPDLPGNPEAIVDVYQLPTGEVVDVTIKRSSGSRSTPSILMRR